MKTLNTEIRINAPAEKVWRILMDFEAYPTWNPFIREISGDHQKGGKLNVLMHPPHQKETRFRPVVQQSEPNRIFEWLGHLLIPGIFDGRHRFEIQEEEEGVRFIHSEKFKGILVSFIWKRLEGPTKAGFEAMNMKLKEIAERDED